MRNSVPRGRRAARTPEILLRIMLGRMTDMQLGRLRLRIHARNVYASPCQELEHTTINGTAGTV